MLSPSLRGNCKVVMFAAAMLVAGASTSLAQGGGAGGAGGAPGGGGTATGAGGASGGAAVPAATSSGGVASPGNEEAASTSDQSERRSKARSAHHRRGRVTEIALGSYYCGSSPCFRIYPPAIYGYAAPFPAVVAPVYRESTLWWPGYYDYAAGQWGRGFPRYGGYGRRAGYYGD